VLTTPPPASERRRPSAAASIARLALFVVVSMLAGVLVAGTALPFIGGIGVAARGAFQGYESLPDQLTTPPLPQSSRILDADGHLLATIYEQNRVEVPLSAIAPVMQQAIVAVEDGRFYDHRGIDIRGLTRAFVGNAGGSSVTQGGSTLTQQYVKNVFVESASTPEEATAARARNFTRKLKEMRYALALERTLTKQQILERYLNIAYFGAGAYGIEAASRRYFSKSASKLTLVEAATLAGIVQQPVAYDPTRNPKSSQKRRQQVLGRMADLGYITQSQATTAGAIPTKSFLKPSSTRNGCTTAYAPFFCDYVYRILKNDPAFGKTPAAREALLNRGGLTIRTTLRQSVQQGAQAAVDKYIPRKDKSQKIAAISMVVPSTGEITAMAENRSWGVKGAGNTTYNFNVGTKYGGSIGAQAGSTFKAFTMAAAFEQNYSPYIYINAPAVNTFKDFKNCQTGAPYKPVTVHNSTNSGTFNMLQGAAYSVNTYFMALEEQITQCAAADMAAKAGLTRGDGSALNAAPRPYPNFTLGIDEVTPLGMSSAYGVFANHGILCQPIAITSVVDRSNKALAVPQSNCKRVMSRAVADSVTAVLSQVIDGPLPGRTGWKMSLGRDAAGKTGTTNNSASVWFVGFTPDLSAAVATFDARGVGGKYAMQNLTIGGTYFTQVFGSTLPGPIWKMAMLSALDGTPKTQFDLNPLDGLGTYVPPPPGDPCGTSASPSPGGTITPFPGASPTVCPSRTPSASSSPSAGPSGSPTPKPTTGPTPKPSTTPSPKPSGT